MERHQTTAGSSAVTFNMLWAAAALQTSSYRNAICLQLFLKENCSGSLTVQLNWNRKQSNHILTGIKITSKGYFNFPVATFQKIQILPENMEVPHFSEYIDS